MIRSLYDDFCKQSGIEFDQHEYEMFYSGWMACREVALSIIETLDGMEEVATEH